MKFLVVDYLLMTIGKAKTGIAVHGKDKKSTQFLCETHFLVDLIDRLSRKFKIASF